MEYRNHMGFKKIGLAQIYNMDCMELLSQTPDNYYELCIVDPPYGIGVGIFEPVGGRGEKNKDSKTWDESIPSPEYFTELRRVSKDQIVWGANYFNCFSHKRGAIIWDKMQPLPDSSQCEIASYSRMAKVGMYQQRWTNFVNTKTSAHPTEKPVALYEWLLTNYAKPGQRILDTHLGSGSSAIACNNLGYELVGCELDPDYYQAACKRVEQASRQIRMFA